MSTVSTGSKTHPAVVGAMADAMRSFWSVAIFSGFVNVLMLAGPLYMLQVYDRVLGSRSLPTLVVLTIFLVIAYTIQGILDAIRARVVLRAAMLLDESLSRPVHQAVVKIGNQSRIANDAHQPVRDLDQIRSFFAGNGPIAIIDLPWIPLFLLLCFLLHPWLGLLGLSGGAVLLVLTLMAERGSKATAQDLSQQSGQRIAMVEASRRNSETIAAMGLGAVTASRWDAVNALYLSALGRSGGVTAGYGSLTKTVRMLIQSAILGLGAWLVVRNELTGGAMIASSIMIGRALSPIETAIANWRSFVSARLSIKRLSSVLAKMGEARHYTPLPKPFRSLDVEGLIGGPPGSARPLVQGVQFSLAPGEALGLIGPSGAGKTTLVRLLLGIWPMMAGQVRLDGAALNQWDPDRLGEHIGYLSQNVELFDGTVGENIARLGSDIDADALLKASKAAGAHEMILNLPQGYDTPIGEGGAAVSAGQRQRIALARALYGDPFLIVLDEPNSNLDNDGEIALQQAILGAKARGAVVVLIAHRPASVAVCDRLLVISAGVQKLYGPRDEVLAKLSGSAQPAMSAPKPIRPAGAAS